MTLKPFHLHSEGEPGLVFCRSSRPLNATLFGKVMTALQRSKKGGTSRYEGVALTANAAGPEASQSATARDIAEASCS